MTAASSVELIKLSPELQLVLWTVCVGVGINAMRQAADWVISLVRRTRKLEQEDLLTKAEHEAICQRHMAWRTNVESRMLEGDQQFATMNTKLDKLDSVCNSLNWVRAAVLVLATQGGQDLSKFEDAVGHHQRILGKSAGSHHSVG